MPWIFVLIFGYSCLSFGYPEIGGYRPQGLHVWRQTDCLAITQRYYAEDRGFFEPAMLYLGPEGSGRTVSDFPLFYYGIGKLWRITGKSELLYRFLVLGCLFVGLLGLCRTLEWLFKDSVWALLITFFLFSSPFLAYYAFSFLMDVPALAFGLIGLYFFGKYWRSRKLIHYGFFVALYALAGLLKISSAIGFVAISALILSDQVGLLRMRKDAKVLIKPAWQLSLLLLPPVLWYLWYSWAAGYNSAYNEHIFLIGILPIWKMSSEELNRVMIMLWNTWRGHYLHIYLQYFSAAGLLFSMVRFRVLPNFISGFLALCVAAFVAFFLLFMQVFDNHDYYALNLLILFPAICAAFIMALQRTWPQVVAHFLPKILGVIVLLISLNWAGRRLNDRYDSWLSKNSRELTNAYSGIGPFLEEKGIGPEAKVMAWPGGVINASLYLMERKGWTNYGSTLQTEEEVGKRIAQGAEYLFIDPDTEGMPEQFAPYVQDSVGSFRGIRVFRMGEKGR